MNFLQDQLKDETNSKYIFDGLYLVGILGMLYYGATEYVFNLLFLSFLSYKTLLQFIKKFLGHLP